MRKPSQYVENVMVSCIAIYQTFEIELQLTTKGQLHRP